MGIRLLLSRLRGTAVRPVRSPRRCLLSFDALESRLVLTTMFPSYHFVDAHEGISPHWSPSPSGFTPNALRNAYGVNSVRFGSIAGDGAGQTIAIVAAYDQPNIESDLAVFSSTFGLPMPPSFTKIDQYGGTNYPAPGNGWSIEISLDVQWSHAMAPAASILLVLAESNNSSDLWQAVDTARNYPGVSVVSMSFGADETFFGTSIDSYFTTPAGHQGVTFVASTGDHGAYAPNTTTIVPQFPATSPNVVAVGGTALSASGSGVYFGETGWGAGTSSGTQGGSGGGISQSRSKPTYQNSVTTPSATQRTTPDVSIVASPSTGVPIYNSYDGAGQGGNWLQVGGTSLSAPLWAGLIAVANQGRSLYGLPTLDGRGGTLPKLYSAATSSYRDVTSGNNGYAAGPGYDLVTGLGTPIADRLVSDLIGSVPTIGGFNPTLADVNLGGTTILSASDVNVANGTIANVNFYRESNGVVGFQLGADMLVSAGTRSGTTWQSLISTATLATGHYTYYAVATDSVGTRSLPAATAVSVTAAAGFPNWSAIGPAISQVSLAAGPIDAVSIVDGGDVVYSGPLDVSKTLHRIRGNLGPSGAGDGSLFDNSGGLLPPADSWFEFLVDPANGSNLNLSANVPSPGPMRLYLASDGRAYFTGDGGVTVVALGATALPPPTIGSFVLSPAVVANGASSTLIVSNLDVASGTLASINFYRESNGVAGLQVGSDAYLGPGLPSGSTWVRSAGAGELLPGSYAFYAVAIDSNGGVATASATLTIDAAVVSGTLIGWDVANQVDYGIQGFSPTFVANGVASGLGLTRGAGVETFGGATGSAWGGSNWANTSAAALAGDQTVSFGFTVRPGQVASLSSLNLSYRRSTSGGPPNGFWQFQIGNGAWTTIGSFTNQFPQSTNAVMTPLNLSSIAALQDLPGQTTVTFRFAPFGATSTGANWYIVDRFGNDLSVSGTVLPATTTTLSTVQNPAVFGQANSVAVTVAGGGGTPTGSVQLFDGGILLGTMPLTAGAATFDVSALTAGAHALSAVYLGSATHGASSSAAPLAIVVTPAATTVALTSSPNPSAGGVAVTLTATIAVVAPGGGVPTGNVEFWDGGVGSGILLGSSPLTTDAGVASASLSLASLAPGSHTIVAVYAGSANHLPSQSSPIQHGVLGSPPVLLSTIVNGADPELRNLESPYTQQRSMVRSVQLTFSAPVILSSNAVALALHDGVGVLPEILIVANSTGGTGLDAIWNVTFAGASILGGSIADGEYDLSIDPGGVTDVAGQNLAAAPPAFTFYRLLGDSNGDRTVNTVDIVNVRREAGTTSASPGYLWLFDTDWNGTINLIDVINFRKNAGKSI